MTSLSLSSRDDSLLLCLAELSALVALCRAKMADINAATEAQIAALSELES